MGSSDINRRLQQNANLERQRVQNATNEFNSFVANCTELKVFKEKYLKPFRSIIKDCGYQLGYFVETSGSSKKPWGYHAERIGFKSKVRDSLWSHLFPTKGGYVDTYTLGQVYYEEYWDISTKRTRLKFRPLFVTFPGTDDKNSRWVEFESIPADVEHAKRWLNQYLYDCHV